MRCKAVRKALEELGELGLTEAGRQHLAACPECQTWWKDLEWLRAGFLQLKQEEPPQPTLGFAQRMVRRLEERPAPAWRPSDLFEQAGRRVVWATLLLTLALLLGMTLPSSGPVRGADVSEIYLTHPEQSSYSEGILPAVDQSDEGTTQPVQVSQPAESNRK